MNTWIYPVEDGWVMIDTGYENSYAFVVKKLRSLLIQPEEIRHIFLTHAHDDHAGFLEEWMTKHPHTQVIAHEKSIEGLRKGQNRFVGGCSTLGAFLFFQLMALLGNGEHRYPRLREEHLAKIITLNEAKLEAIESELNGKILFTPGHTVDSISLLVDGNLFCGDAAMNGIPSSHKITIWVEDKAAFEKSWDVMLASGAKKIHPAHGSPFCPCELRKNKKFIAGLHLRPLKEKV
jgi:glyoxylase-like metal-dependent hydrolase (beta-lactamase superfamily II)